MKKYILIILGLAMAGVFTSCSEDFLEIEQKGVMSYDKYANADDATAERFLAAIYGDVRNLTMGDWGIPLICTATVKVADSWTGGSSPSDGAGYQLMARFLDNAESDEYYTLYKGFYSIIRKANIIVENLNDETAVRKAVVGEAKAWRAWAMMHLTQLWGSAPLVSHTLDGIEYSFTPGNTPAEESWAWIMGQFDEAAELLPSKGSAGGQAAIGGRWTKETCWAFKGKGYMWQNKYAEAKVELAKVINTGYYSLWQGTATMGPSSYGVNTKLYKEKVDAENAEYNADPENAGKTPRQWIDGDESYVYSTVYRAAADFCDEFLLELSIAGDANTIAETEPFWFRAYMNWRKDEYNVPAIINPANDGWGFVNPTKEFGLSFAKHDGNSPRRRANIATFDEVYRMFPHANADVRGVSGENGLFAVEGYFRMKYFDFLDDQDQARYAAGNNFGNITNYPLLRYSNILLYYAEACLKDGEGTANISGLEALNLVRSRAGLTPAPALDMDDEMYGIKAERRFELYLDDCDRYVDLIRWGDYKTFITTKVTEHWGTHCPWLLGFKDPDKVTTDPTDLSNYDVKYDELSQRGSWNDKLLYLPFPYKELVQNPALVQNPGW